jgi:hypothetical protein
LLGFLRTNIRQIYSKFTPGHPTKTKNHLLTAPIAYFLSQCQKVSKTGEWLGFYGEIAVVFMKEYFYSKEHLIAQKISLVSKRIKRLCQLVEAARSGFPGPTSGFCLQRITE